MNRADTLVIECHPPERRRRTEVRICHGSCCCCCCCLHTIGGIVGAAVAPALGSRSSAWSHASLIDYWDEEDHPLGRAPVPEAGQEAIIKRTITDYPPPVAPGQEAISTQAPRTPRHSELAAGAVPNIAMTGVSAVKVYWLLSLTALIVGVLISPAWAGRWSIEVPIISLIILLLVFPAVQLVCALITLSWLALSSRPDRSFQMKQLGKMTLGLFLGTVAGILVMVGIAVVLRWA
jgi:hypothetical protein